MRDEIISSLRARLREVLSAALGEDLGPDDVRIDVAPALLLFRILFDAGRPANVGRLAEEIRQLVTSAPAARPSPDPTTRGGRYG